MPEEFGRRKIGPFKKRSEKINKHLFSEGKCAFIAIYKAHEAWVVCQSNPMDDATKTSSCGFLPKIFGTFSAEFWQKFFKKIEKILYFFALLSLLRLANALPGLNQ